jgi:hypothetical protein
MAWYDDSWKDSYDSWKLASPDDEREDECSHEDYEADINGRATCCRCSHAWWMTDDEIKWERERYESYDRLWRREEWRLWFNQWIGRLAFWRLWRKSAPIDDDIPF